MRNHPVGAPMSKAFQSLKSIFTEVGMNTREINSNIRTINIIMPLIIHIKNLIIRIENSLVKIIRNILDSIHKIKLFPTETLIITTKRETKITRAGLLITKKSNKNVKEKKSQDKLLIPRNR
jgi:hypothetical protein